MKIDGKKIRIARAEKGLSKTDLHCQSGVSRKTIYDMEINSKDVRTATVAKIADCLGKPVEFFGAEEIESRNMTDEVIRDVLATCKTATRKYGDGADYTSGKWLTIAMEEIGEMCQALQTDEPWSKETDKSNLYGEIIDAAAVLVRWAETVKP